MSDAAFLDEEGLRFIFQAVPAFNVAGHIKRIGGKKHRVLWHRCHVGFEHTVVVRDSVNAADTAVREALVRASDVNAVAREPD